ncbi:MAG: hypothetical protein Kow00121_36210 [Elainellaceae cyanobacterium]
MSKENVFEFFNRAANNNQLKDKVQTVQDREELVRLGREQGLEFSSANVDEALTELKQQPGFFQTLMEAVLSIFSPTHDDYPSVGVQPYSGDPNRR